MNQSLGGVKNRRKSALQRLENQLLIGTKTYKEKTEWGYNIDQIPLTESDIKRINGEISILKSKI